VATLNPGNLVRWLNGAAGNVGVVLEAAQAVRVVFDDGEAHLFARGTPALERVTFAVGSKVQSVSDGAIGIVSGSVERDGLLIYQVAQPDGIKVSIESGLRPAVETDPLALIRSGVYQSSRSTNLRLTATRLLYAHRYDELSSLSNSRVEIKPHQVAVLHRVASTFPHRFLLADEVGLGKTIEAGLILKELKARGVATRVLVIAPAGIVSQWQFELKNKFAESFSLYRRDTVDFLRSERPGENVWTLRDNVITSASYATADDQRMRDIALAGWDLVIIDEAHHARSRRESETYWGTTRLYELAQMLASPGSSNSQAFLLLTATPMQLDSSELYSLIELLDPALFPDFPEYQEHLSKLAGLNETVDALVRWPTLDDRERDTQALAASDWLGEDITVLRTELDEPQRRAAVVDRLLATHRLSEVMVRNRKAVVGGFMPRVAVVWPVELTDPEWAAYNAIGEYVRSGYARSQAQRNNALGFLMSTFQKLSSSSFFALRQALVRRIARLEAGALPIGEGADEDDEAIEEDAVASSAGEWIGVQNQNAVAGEIAELGNLVGLIDEIKLDSKARVLLERLTEIADNETDPKVIVFTQSRDTQEFLLRTISGRWKVEVFHGQLKPDEKDAVVARFRDGVGPQVLISTEAGGEGRNFQFCHLLINYDLPWNPMRIEQRIGRLDRIGQKHPVTVINFAVRGTIEERVLAVLSNRIRVFEETIGGLDPILGNVEQDLKAVFLASESEARRALELLDRQLASRVFAARETERRLADLIMDTKSYRQDEVSELLEQRGVIDDNAIRRFVLAALQELDVRIEEDPDLPNVYDIKLRGQFLNQLPQFATDGVRRRATFNPAVALEFENIEFLAFGHELVDALVERVRTPIYPGLTSHRLIRTDKQAPQHGWFFAFTLELDGVVNSKELLPVFVDSSGIEDPSLAMWLLERAGSARNEEPGTAEVLSREGEFEQAATQAEGSALQRLLAMQSELTDANRTRLEQERSKLTKYYEYRERAAAEKLASVQEVFDRVSASEDPEIARIVPVWLKNLENANGVVHGLAAERDRRLAYLNGREQVMAQQELISASYVSIIPKS
jgi:ATP-dependent helicase HepA